MEIAHQIEVNPTMVQIFVLNTTHITGYVVNLFYQQI